MRNAMTGPAPNMEQPFIAFPRKAIFRHILNGDQPQVVDASAILCGQ